MPRIAVPEGQDPAEYVWSLAPHITPSAQAYSAQIYANTKLSLREMEAARIRIAQLNGCQACRNWRAYRDNAAYVGHAGVDASQANFKRAEPIPEEFYASVENWRNAPPVFSTRERLAIEFADRFARDHLSFDQADALWDELHENFSDSELVDLTLCVGSWIAFGRFARVFDIDGACRVDFSGKRAPAMA